MPERHFEMSGRHVKMSGDTLAFFPGKMFARHLEMSGRHVEMSGRHLGTFSPVRCLRDMLTCLGDILPVFSRQDVWETC